ncbi:MAG: glycosyltransferase [Phycisphaerae bacterium]|nr:glycosyltransferase [Phycisphaerae bacterium]
MRVFMLGWEFPPFISGGLGTACFGLTRALDRLGTEVLFVLPRAVANPEGSHVQILSPSSAGVRGKSLTLGGMFQHTQFRAVAAALRPYARPDEPFDEDDEAGLPGGRVAPGGVRGHRPRRGPRIRSVLGPGTDPGGNYSGDMFAEIERYAALASVIAAEETFDLIHAHDWMTYLAGIAVQAQSGKPLVVHVHSTEFDRSGMNVNQRIYDIERAGIHAATKVIAVSHLTRSIVLKHYGVDPRKVEVVYNAIDDREEPDQPPLPPITRDEKIVLFLGRVTMQKGPEYFLAAAKRVLEVMDNVRFVVAGSGDMIRRMIELAAEMGIGHKVLFTGFLRGNDVRRVYRMADLYVMPSVSEPFGLTPLEALSNDVPVLISKQSGVAEVLNHALKVDFWDVDEMANKIVAVLRHPPLHATLRDHGSFEVKHFSWLDSAANCIKVYEAALGPHAS